MTDTENKVMLQVEVRESTRTRLKLQAVRLGVTMGELADELLDEALNKLEQQQKERDKPTDWQKRGITLPWITTTSQKIQYLIAIIHRNREPAENLGFFADKPAITFYALNKSK